MAIAIQGGGGENLKPQLNRQSDLLAQLDSILAERGALYLQEKTVEASYDTVTVEPDENHSLIKVIVEPNPALIEDLNYQAEQIEELKAALADKGALPVQDKIVTAGTETIAVTADTNYRLGKITVNPTPSQSKTVTPVLEGMTIKPDAGKLLSQVVLNEFELPSPEGEYVWKKYEYQQMKQEDKTKVYVSSGANTSDAYNYIYASDYTVDYDTGIFTLTNPQTFSSYVTMGGKPPLAGNYIIAISDDMLDAYIADDLKMSGKELLFIPTEATLTTSGSPKGRIASNAISYTVQTIGDFLDYIVSSDPEAYPDGGEQEGFWYERVSELVVKTGTYTPSANVSSTLSIPHGLGETPKYVGINKISVACSSVSSPANLIVSADETNIVISGANAGKGISIKPSEISWIAVI